jgi:chromosome segregation ATPase
MALDIDSLIERVESTHKKYIEEKTRFKNETESLTNDKKSLKESLDNLQNSFNNLSNANEDLNKKYNDLELSYKSIEETLSQKETLILDFNKKSQEQEDVILNLNETISKLKENLESKEKELANTSSKDSVKEILNNDSAVYKELLNKYEDLQKNTDDIIASLKDDLFNKSEELSEINNKLSAEKNKYLDLKEKTYHTIKHLVEDVIEKHEAEINKLNTDKDELLKKIASQDSSIAKLNAENADLTREIVTLKAQIKKLHEDRAATKEVKRTSLEDFIDSTIPVPEDSAAANLRPVKKVSEITENTIPYNFGRTSKEIMNKVLLLIDKLFEGVNLNNNNEYPLNNPQIVCDEVNMDKVTLSTVLNRLTSMAYNNRPLLVYKGNLYYATIDKDTIKNYISEN